MTLTKNKAKHYFEISKNNYQYSIKVWKEYIFYRIYVLPKAFELKKIIKCLY